MSNGSTGPLGRQRGIGFVILMFLITLGIYGIYWIFITFAELRAHRGQGVSGLVGLLLALIPVSIFLLPSYVGRAYQEDGRPAPISGLTGVWALIPLVGGIIWLIRVQGTLNGYWESKTVGAATPAQSVEETL